MEHIHSPPAGLASFRVERGVPFCAQTTRFHTDAGPLAYGWVEIVVIREGTGVVTVVSEDRREVLRPGSALVVMPNTAVDINPDGNMTMTRVFVRTSYLVEQVAHKHPTAAPDLVAARVVSRELFGQRLQIAAVPEAYFEQVGGWLDTLSELTAAKLLCEEFWRAQGLLSFTMRVILPQLPGDQGLRGTAYAKSGQAVLPGLEHVRYLPWAAQKALKLIEERFDQPWTITDLAAEVGMCRSGLMKHIQTATGKSVLELRCEYRVQEMARLLLDETVTVAKAARLVGWAREDQARRCFKKLAGVSPAVWRDEVRVVRGDDAADCLLEPAYRTQFRGSAGVPGGVTG